MKKLDIISCGEVMVELFGSGTLSQSPTFHKAYAGDTMNMISMATKLGLKCGYITNVGNDPFKDYLLDEWKALNIDLECTQIIEGFNGVHFTVLQEDNNRQFVYYRKDSAASRLDVKSINENYLKTAKVFHTSSLTQCISESAREAVSEYLIKSKSLGITTSFDTNFRSNIWSASDAKNAILDVIKYIDILSPSYPEEVNKVFELDTPVDMIKFGLAQWCKLVVVKCGEEGAYIGNSNRIIFAQATTPKGLLDTTGAGDSFLGGFFYSYIKDMNLEDNMRYAITSAGLKVSARGGIQSQPSKNEVEKYLNLVKVKEINHH